MNQEERMAHINAAENVLGHELVIGVMEEFALNMGFELSGLPKYGLMKIAKYAATVARVEALGLDINDFRSTPAEHVVHAAQIAKKMSDAGKPVIVVVAPEEE